MSRYQSWGRFPKLPQRARVIAGGPLELAPGDEVLAFGNGRSYGDSCLFFKHQLK